MSFRKRCRGMAKYETREAWARSFLLYPRSKDHQLMLLAESGEAAIFVSGELFKIDGVDNAFFSLAPTFHVWFGDKWAYCGPNEKSAWALFEAERRRTHPLIS